MNAYKTFTNQSDVELTMTLLIRKGEDPQENYGTKIVTLTPKSTKGVEFGNDKNAYLNGIRIEASCNGSTLLLEQRVYHRDSEFDQILNNYNNVVIVAIQPLLLEAYD
ncbi:MAG: hypothetical protein AMJ53_14365 [Gammaproteobacteria bacterium SG8_11]|nr:MAG: hypothetical protein AMJ53_14365 [Gammaproteobacteria bacterium SG8_11]